MLPYYTTRYEYSYEWCQIVKTSRKVVQLQSNLSRTTMSAQRSLQWMSSRRKDGLVGSGVYFCLIL